MVSLHNADCKEMEVSDDVIVVTDPPFNIGYHYNSYKDKMAEKDYIQMLAELVKGKRFVIIHYPEMINKLSIAIGEAPTKVVSWVYNSNTAKQHRDIAFYRVTPDFRKVRQPYKNPNDKRIKERIANGSGGETV